MEPVIRVHNLGKLYRIGERQPYHTIRETIMGAAGAPMRAMRHALGMRNGARSANRNDELWALRDVSFEVNRGEVLGIIGRNGAGKSTLLKILSRITYPTTGQVEMEGRVGSLLEVGTGFHPELTGRDNIYLSGAMLGMRRAEIARKFDEIVDFAGVERFIDTPVKRYSSGMYVRLGFAVAAHLEPEILVVDEVLAVGDFEFQKKCLGKMGDVARHGRTVLMVSHNLASVANLCQRAILFDQGEIVRDGPAKDVTERYMASARSSSAEVRWHDTDGAPGNEVARLLAVRVLQGDSRAPMGDVDISEEISIELTFRNLRSGARLLPGLLLRDQVGTVVLATNNLPSLSATRDPWEGRCYSRNTFRSVCRIPANFLNEGTYFITIIVTVDMTREAVFKEDALSFRVQDTGQTPKEYFGPWPGTVKVRLAWHTDLVDATAVRKSGESANDTHKFI